MRKFHVYIYICIYSCQKAGLCVAGAMDVYSEKHDLPRGAVGAVVRYSGLKPWPEGEPKPRYQLAFLPSGDSQRPPPWKFKAAGDKAALALHAFFQRPEAGAVSLSVDYSSSFNFKLEKQAVSTEQAGRWSAILRCPTRKVGRLWIEEVSVTVCS